MALFPTVIKQVWSELLSPYEQASWIAQTYKMLQSWSYIVESTCQSIVLTSIWTPTQEYNLQAPLK